jgi:cytochrome P450
MQEVFWSSADETAPPAPLANFEHVSAPERLFVDLYLHMGPIFRLPQPGKAITVLAGPEANLFLLRAGDTYLSMQDIWRDFDAQLGLVNFGRDGELRHQLRSIMSRCYARGNAIGRIQEMVDITLEHTQDWQAGQLIPVVSWLQRLVADQLGQVLVHQRPGDALQDVEVFFNTLLRVTIAHLLPVSELDTEEFKKAKQGAFALGRAVIEAHRNGSADHERDLMDSVLAAAVDNPDILNEANLIFAALGPFQAGLDTVTNTSGFLLYALLKHPEVYRRVCAEIDRVSAAGGPLTWEKLKTMIDLRGASMETLRRYPVATAHFCKVTQPFTFAGYRVDEGERILVATTVAHFLPHLFPNPEQFDIDRYRDPRNEHRRAGAYVPFGIGTHTCLGSGIAEIQLMVISATLLRHFQFELVPPDYTLQPVQAPAPSPGPDFHLRVVGRRHPLIASAGRKAAL